MESKDQRLELLDCAEVWIYFHQAGNGGIVFRKVDSWEYRVKTDAFHTQLLYVVQARCYPADVTYSIVLYTVLERSWEYFVEKTALPPLDWRITPECLIEVLETRSERGRERTRRVPLSEQSGIWNKYVIMCFVVDDKRRK